MRRTKISILITLLFIAFLGNALAHGKNKQKKRKPQNVYEEPALQFMNNYLDLALEGNTQKISKSKFFDSQLEQDLKDFQKCINKKCTARLREDIPSHKYKNDTVLTVYMDYVVGKNIKVARPGCYLLIFKKGNLLLDSYLYDCQEK